jgi:hypothetical protein
VDDDFQLLNALGHECAGAFVLSGEDAPAREERQARHHQVEPCVRRVAKVGAGTGIDSTGACLLASIQRGRVMFLSWPGCAMLCTTPAYLLDNSRGSRRYVGMVTCTRVRWRR